MHDGDILEIVCTSPQAQAYATLQFLESELRGFIMRTMEARFGVGWEKDRIPQTIVTKWKRRQYERDNRAYPWMEPVGHICELADFSDCKQVIQTRSNWCDVFESVFRDSEAIGKKLDELYALRNEVTHMRPLSPTALETLDRITVSILRSIRAGAT